MELLIIVLQMGALFITIIGTILFIVIKISEEIQEDDEFKQSLSEDPYKIKSTYDD